MAEVILDHPCLSRRLPHKSHKISPGQAALLPDELVREILTRLPVKSLMRFKCASKIWLSIITDPSFADAYRGGFEGLLISEPFSRLGKVKRFYYASVDDADNRSSYHFFPHRTMDHGDQAMGYTETLNGLYCFYFGDYSCLYNPATRERLELPSSAIDGDASSKSWLCSYHFGYDPVNKLYKLLKICPLYEEDDEGDLLELYFEYEEMNFVQHLNCQILTIGVDSSWRILESHPPRDLLFRNRCINGVLYWLEPGAEQYHLNTLVAFDLIAEKFQLIPTPRDHQSFVLPMFSPTLALTRDGFPTRALGRNGWGSETEDTEIYHYRDGMWEQQRFPSPKPLIGLNTFTVGILPNGKVFITGGPSSFLDPIYLYDPTRRELEYVDPGSSMGYCSGMYASYHRENIIPLKCLILNRSSGAGIAQTST